MIETVVDDGKIVRTLDLSQSFPGLPDPCVERPTLLAALLDLMTRNFDVIFLDGPEDAGKTTALSQFVERHDSRSLSLFLRPVTEFTYDPVRIRLDLCNQAWWHLYGTPYAGNDQPDGGHLRALFRRLEQQALRNAQPYFFVVDGLADIPKESAGVRKAILDALPIGAPSFRFLVSGSLEVTGLDIFPKLKNRSQLIGPFSLEDAGKLFGTVLNPEQLEEIHKTCNGSIGRLASIRRIISTGVTPEEILAAAPEHAPAIFEIEWNQIKLDLPLVSSLLEFAAHTPEIASVSWLRDTLEIDDETIKTTIRSIPCLRIEPQSGMIVFVSETFRKYAAQRLKHREAFVLQGAVTRLREHGTATEAFKTVPEYLERQGDISSLISYFDTNTLAQALQASKSIALIIERLGRASRLAFKNGKQDAGVRYIVQAAALREVLVTRGDRAWVEAALDLRGESAALELASQAFSDERRLRLLALIARKQRSRGLQTGPQMLNEIDRLSSAIDWTQLRDQAFKTASDLLPVAPEIGLKIIENSLGREGDANAVDAAISASFMRAAMASDARSYRRELLDRAFEKTRSEEFKGVLATLSGVSTASTATQLLRDLDRPQHFGASSPLSALASHAPHLSGRRADRY